MSEQQDQVYTWDQPAINNVQENDFVLLPPGDYPFTVIKFERGRYEPKPDGKLPACPQAIISCKVEGGAIGETVIKHNLYLHSKCQGIIAQFFKGIGLRKSGEPLVMAWNQVVGKQGRCKIAHRLGSDGNTYNELKRILDPVDSSHSAPDSEYRGQF